MLCILTISPAFASSLTLAEKRVKFQDSKTKISAGFDLLKLGFEYELKPNLGWAFEISHQQQSDALDIGPIKGELLDVKGLTIKSWRTVSITPDLSFRASLGMMYFETDYILNKIMTGNQRAIFLPLTIGLRADIAPRLSISATKEKWLHNYGGRYSADATSLSLTITF